MTTDKIQALLAQGEGIEVEFKKSDTALSQSAFDTTVAFLNRNGGHLLLGVTDEGVVQGISPDFAIQLCNQIMKSTNNSQKINPPFYISPELVEVEGKTIIYMYVPQSSQVHKHANKIFDRNQEGDLDITQQPESITQMYLRKQAFYFENTIYPYLSITDFREDLFVRIRQLAKNNRPDHPWLEMDNETILKSFGLYKKDYQTGKEGYSLASVLLLGKDEVIQNILPHYKTDAIRRVDNLDRYDDREDIRTNLIESYDKLMNFVRKHLPDNFYLENDQRISIRDKIFREVIANVLIHREFSNAYPAKLLIEKQQATTENWNKIHQTGQINPANFSPFPKNPTIARFFKELGRVDELGSGVRNTYKYVRLYTPSKEPQFLEGDIFKTIIPLPTANDQVNDYVTDQVTEDIPAVEVSETDRKILEYTQKPKAKKDILENVLNLQNHTDNYKKYIEPLLLKGLLQRTMPDKPKSQHQKYSITLKGKQVLG
jgi:ATP-dependent DNA helicase RecG